MAPVIVAKDLYKCYAGFPPVLRGVNIEVQAGELVAIMGPSGCGKSTMLHVLGMLHAPDAGSLEILGTDVLTFSREQTAAFRRGNMGFVMQSSNLFEHSTVFENVEFPLIYENVPPQERWERVIRALDLVRLSARVHYRSNRLSGGEQQRVAIARAMVNNPRILLADEPTGALDARTSRVIMENFRTLCHTGGVSMVLVTHDPKMAEYCDSIYTLEDGILHCRQHRLPPERDMNAPSLLQAPPPVVHGALVAEYFPESSGQCLMEEAHRLYSAGLLSRIYAIRGSSFLADPAGYALPLAVRRIGFWRLLYAGLLLFRQTRALSHTLWHIWRDLPGGKGVCGHLFGRFRAFICGVLLARWALEEKIEFFYAAGAQCQGTASWVAARMLRRPFAFAVRAQELPHMGRDWAVKAADAVFVRCDTQETQNTLRALFPLLPPEKFVLLRDPLTLTPPEDDMEIPLSLKGQQAETELCLLAVGSMCRRKGYDVLLRACALLKVQGVRFRLTIVGQGPWRLRLRWLALRLGLRKQLVFTGQIPHENMPDYYKKADIFICPGIRTRQGDVDGLPSALAEAMAFGRAVIVSDLPSLLEIVEHGRNGLVTPQHDVAALCTAMKELAVAPEERRRLGEAARVRIHALLDRQESEMRLNELFIRAARQISSR
ncbi:MAG: ATP-binding cassette domain-containing protein [Desulfovibrio sp.]|nr:ATP-binding cassette domain-containing protein [Desulfovibrio sp.]